MKGEWWMLREMSTLPSCIRLNGGCYGKCPHYLHFMHKGRMRILRDVLITFMHMIDGIENRDVIFYAKLFTFLILCRNKLMDEDWLRVLVISSFGKFRMKLPRVWRTLGVNCVRLIGHKSKCEFEVYLYFLFLLFSLGLSC